MVVLVVVVSDAVVEVSVNAVDVVVDVSVSVNVEAISKVVSISVVAVEVNTVGLRMVEVDVAKKIVLVMNWSVVEVLVVVVVGNPKVSVLVKPVVLAVVNTVKTVPLKIGELSN